MQRLKANGQYTHYEEGIEPAIIRLTQESLWRKRTIILVTDDLSDPDKHHRRVSPEQLSSRVPKGIRFYIIDLRNQRYLGNSAKRVGNGKFVGYTKPGKNFTVFPIQASRLNELLPLISGRSLYMIPWYPYSLYALAGIVVILIVGMIILLRRRNSRDDLFEGEEVTDDEPQGHNSLVQITVGDVERRFGAPVKLTIGGRKRDDFTVKGARSREILLRISEGKELFRHRQGLFRKLTGPIYRSRTFTLKNGVSVLVRLGANNHSLHRYLKEV